MMVSGELDAVIFYLLDPNLVDRSTVDLHSHPDIKPLFPDPWAEGVRFYRKTGLYPINHGMVIKRELAERHPWAITNILKAFNQANEIAEKQRMEHVEYHIETGLLPADAGKALASRDHPARRRRQPQGARNHRAVFGRAGPHAAAGEARGDFRPQHDEPIGRRVPSYVAAAGGTPPSLSFGGGSVQDVVSGAILPR